MLLVLVTTRWHPLLALDRTVAGDLNSADARHHGVVTVLRAISTVGQPLTFQLLAVVAGIALWRIGRGTDGMFVAFAVLAAGLLSTIVKSFVTRARPTVEVTLSHPHGSSFPSGHAIASFVAAGALVLVLGPRARQPVAAAAAVVALLVGFSRLALGVHYLSDVVAAWLLGFAWLIAARGVLRSPARRRPGRRAPDRPPGTPAC